MCTRAFALFRMALPAKYSFKNVGPDHGSGPRRTNWPVVEKGRKLSEEPEDQGLATGKRGGGWFGHFLAARWQFDKGLATHSDQSFTMRPNSILRVWPSFTRSLVESKSFA